MKIICIKGKVKFLYILDITMHFSNLKFYYIIVKLFLIYYLYKKDSKTFILWISQCILAT